MKQKAMDCITSLLIMILALALGGCGKSSRIELDPDSQDFYDYARLIMTKQEKNIFKYLPDKESREEFIKDFWAKRDPDPDTEQNEFKEEFFRRLDYANKRFREGIPGWKTDRGRIYIYLGPPDKIEQRPYLGDPAVKGLLWWGYYRYRLGIEFVDRTGDGSYSLSRQSGAAGGLLEVIERAKFGQIYAGEGDFRKALSDLKLNYDSKTREIYVSIPVEALEFRAEDRFLKADFGFEFFIYEKKGTKKDRFKRQEAFEMAEDEVMKLDEISFAFPYELSPGQYYFDLIVVIEPNVRKIRKIFLIKY